MNLLTLWDTQKKSEAGKPTVESVSQTDAATVQHPHFLRPNLLIHPTIPDPLFSINPRTLLGREWWDAIRHQAYAANNQCCWACGVHRSHAKLHQWLEGHEVYDIDYPHHRMTFSEVVALCHFCHMFIHKGLLSTQVKQQKLTKAERELIYKHGEGILRQYGLMESYIQQRQKWHKLSKIHITSKTSSKWHLSLKVDGKEKHVYVNR